MNSTLNPISTLLGIISPYLDYNGHQVEQLQELSNEWWLGLKEDALVKKILGHPLVMIAIGLIGSHVARFIHDKIIDWLNPVPETSDPVEMIFQAVDEARRMRDAARPPQ